MPDDNDKQFSESNLTQIKEELADAYAKQMKLEMQLKNRDGVIYHLKASVEHQRLVIKDLQDKIKELLCPDTNIGVSFVTDTDGQSGTGK